jgi:hypothetical protein
MGDRVVQPASRAELVRRRYAKTGWIIVGIGVIVPVLAAVGAYRGWRLMRLDRRSGLPLLLVGGAVFVVRLALWASTGFTSAF